MLRGNSHLGDINGETISPRSPNCHLASRVPLSFKQLGSNPFILYILKLKLKCVLNFLKEESECRLCLSVALYLNVVATVSCRCPPGMQDIVLLHPDRLQQVIQPTFTFPLHNVGLIIWQSKHQPILVKKIACFFTLTKRPQSP